MKVRWAWWERLVAAAVYVLVIAMAAVIAWELWLAWYRLLSEHA